MALAFAEKYPELTRSMIVIDGFPQLDSALKNNLRLQGGQWYWQDIIFAAMPLQSLAATNQARLLLGPPNVLRIDPPTFAPPIALDDYERAVELLAPAADDAVKMHADRLEAFFQTSASTYVPMPAPA